VQEVEADLTAEELCNEQVALTLQVLNDTSVHLGQELVKGRFIITGLFDDIEGRSGDLSILDRSVVGQEGQAPIVEVM